MSQLTIPDLKARVAALKAAPMFSKAQLAEQALQDLLQYLEQQQTHIEALAGFVLEFAVLQLNGKGDKFYLVDLENFVNELKGKTNGQ